MDSTRIIKVGNRQLCTCDNCGWHWLAKLVFVNGEWRSKDPKRCPNCRKVWRRPGWRRSFFERIKAAWLAFMAGNTDKRGFF